MQVNFPVRNIGTVPVTRQTADLKTSPNYNKALHLVAGMTQKECHCDKTAIFRVTIISGHFSEFSES